VIIDGVRVRLRNLLLTAALFILQSAGFTQSLVWLDSIQPAVGVSRDGSVVIGWSGVQAARWTPSGGVELLGTLGGCCSWPTDVSRDGSAVVGAASNEAGYALPFRWTSHGGMQSLLTSGWVDGTAWGISADGSVVVGWASDTTSTQFAFRWTENTGLQPICPGIAYAVSDDGRVVVGVAHSGAFWWTTEGGWKYLEPPPSHADCDSMTPIDVSGDGNVVVGMVLKRGRPGHEPYEYIRAFKWTAGAGTQDLGTLGGKHAEARGVSADGSIVVGWADNAHHQMRAFRWTASRGMEDLNLTYSYLLTPGSMLWVAEAISSDGRYIVGEGYKADSGRTGFLLDTGLSSNRPPAVPTLLSPAAGESVTARPTFGLVAADPDGDMVRFELEVWKGDDRRVFFVPESGYVRSGVKASRTAPEALPQGTWYWRARTWDTRGASSNWSASRWFRVVASLNAPTDLQAQAVSSSEVRLTWRDNSNDETGFEIQRRLRESTGYTTVARLPANMTTFTDKVLSPKTAYTYRVRAVDTPGQRVSDWSNEASVTTLEETVAAPSDLRARAISSHQIQLTWKDNSSNEAGFEVWRVREGEERFTLVKKVPANTAAYTDAGLQPQTTYTYVVRAYTASGTRSANSNPASATTLSGEEPLVLYRANLHAHTSYSDGAWVYQYRSAEPRDAYNLVAVDLDVLAITDHAEQLSQWEWEQTLGQAAEVMVSPGRFVALRGFEWTGAGEPGGCSPTPNTGHINVIGSTTRVGAYKCADEKYEIDWNDVKMTLYTFYGWLSTEAVAVDGGLPVAQFNHPTTYDGSDHFNNFALPDNEPRRSKLRQIFALMELGSHVAPWYSFGYEGRSDNLLTGNEAEDRARSNEYWFRVALAKGWKVAPSCNQDTHLWSLYTGQDGLRAFHTGILAKNVAGLPISERVSVILEALRARRVFSSEDVNSEVRLRARLPGQSGWYWMGSSIVVSPDEEEIIVRVDTFNYMDSPITVWDVGFKSIELFASPHFKGTEQELNNPLRKDTDISRFLKSGRSLEWRIPMSELLRLPTNPFGEIYLYVRVRQLDDDLLYSAPIWIKIDRRQEPPPAENGSGAEEPGGADTGVPVDEAEQPLPPPSQEEPVQGKEGQQ
jgi:probable HAF family extracellular repeat protein